MYLTQRIGKTTYRVKVAVNESGTQTLEDTLLRLIRNNNLANSGDCDIIKSIRRDAFPKGTGRHLKLIRWRRASSFYLSNGLLPARMPSLAGYNRSLRKEPRITGKGFQVESRYDRFHNRKSFA